MARSLTKASMAEAAVHLASADPDLGRLLSEEGVPPLWARRPGFATLIRILLEQQVSLASAKAIYGRLREGVHPFTPEGFRSAGVERLRELGLTRQKADYCVGLAEGIHSGRLDLRVFSRMDDDAARAALLKVKGIGPWTADIYLLMALRRPDIWPIGDLALVQAVRELKRLRTRPSAERWIRLAEPWRPHRAVAARMLWQHYLRRQG